MSKDNVAKRAVMAAGGAPAVARLFGITRIAVYEWIEKNRVPAVRCPALERAGKSAVLCEEIRPDVDWAFLRPTTAA